MLLENYDDFDGFGNESGSEDFDHDGFYDPDGCSENSSSACEDSYVIPGISSSAASFHSFTIDSFAVFDLDSEEGWCHALVAIDGYMEWCSANYSDSFVCRRVSVALHCFAAMVVNAVSSPFRNTVKLYLFLLACWEWSDFFSKFVDLDDVTGKVFCPFFTSTDVQRANHACNRISAYFITSKDSMRKISTNLSLLEF